MQHSVAENFAAASAEAQVLTAIKNVRGGGGRFDWAAPLMGVAPISPMCVLLWVLPAPAKKLMAPRQGPAVEYGSFSERERARRGGGGRGRRRGGRAAAAAAVSRCCFLACNGSPCLRHCGHGASIGGGGGGAGGGVRGRHARGCALTWAGAARVLPDVRASAWINSINVRYFLIVINKLYVSVNHVVSVCHWPRWASEQNQR
jgi:hypothetical protein